MSKKNPDVGRAAVPDHDPQAVASSMPVATHFAGADLVPSAADLRGSGGVLRTFRYWIGMTPSCPLSSIDIAGVNFPKVNELLVPDPMGGHQRKRVPVIGAVVNLTERHVRKLRDRLKRTVIRVIDQPAVQEEPGTGLNVGDPVMRPRRGIPITIPTAAEIAERQAKGKPTRAYVADSRDVPAAHFLYAVLCADQKNGSRGSHYPETLDVTGLVWPDEIDEKAFLS